MNWAIEEVTSWINSDESLYQEAREIVERAGSVGDGARRIEIYWSEKVEEVIGKEGVFHSLPQAALEDVNQVNIAGSVKPAEWGGADETPEEEDQEEDTKHDA